MALLLLFASCGAVIAILLPPTPVPELRATGKDPFQWPTRRAPVLGAIVSEPHLYYPAQGSTHSPAVPAYNRPPATRPRTPLFIPFTRNNAMMRQTILGYVAAGWPRADIVIIDNSGTFDANNKKLLSEDNPFFLDYDLFRSRYGVSIQQTPTLLNFAQLQNFMLRIALSRNWPYYFWSHMDVGILSEEETTPYMSFYHRVLQVMRDADVTERRINGSWAAKFFQFDNLVLVNAAAWREIGQWDVFIPYYATDCDAYARSRMLGHTTDDVTAGHIYDVADAVSDPERKFFPPEPQPPSPFDREGTDFTFSKRNNTESEPNSPRFQSLKDELEQLSNSKLSNSKGRNTWQNKQKGGKGEPWTYDPVGFQDAWWDTAEAGRKLFNKKWGTSNCYLLEEHITLDDAWKNAEDVSG